MNKLYKVFWFTTLSLFLSCSLLAHGKVIHKERSMYRNILVEEISNLRCLKFNVKSSKTNQSCFYTNDPQRLVFNYTKLLFSSLLVAEKAPEKILIIGLGGGTMSNTLHQIYPKAEIENVEIDPAVINVAREYFAFFENDKVTSKAQDGRIFMKRAALKNKQYDWIILDAFNGDYIPEHLMTKEFLQEAKSLLTDDGVLASNTFSVSKLYQHESATYKAVFGNFFNVSNSKNSNRIILASLRPLPDGKVIADRAKALHARLKPFGIDIFEITTYMNSTVNHQDWADNTKVLTDQFSPANLLNLSN